MTRAFSVGLSCVSLLELTRWHVSTLADLAIVILQLLGRMSASGRAHHNTRTSHGVMPWYILLGLAGCTDAQTVPSKVRRYHCYWQGNFHAQTPSYFSPCAIPSGLIRAVSWPDAQVDAMRMLTSYRRASLQCTSSISTGCWLRIRSQQKAS